MVPDQELLQKFAGEGAQDALAELVRRKVDFVYAVALRQVAGDAHLAEEVTQAVFMALARDAARLARHTALAGWLFTTTRFAASKAVRTHQRWKRREQEANAMNLTEHDTPEPSWERLRPVIDEALGELGEADRTALLLRYFDGRSLAAVGAALGLEENSARMRVNRALEKLGERLAKRGITSTVAALGVALASQPAVTAPGAFVTSLAASGALGGAATPFTLMKIVTLVTSMAAAGAVGVGGTYWKMREQAQLRAAQVEERNAATMAGLHSELARLKTEVLRLQAAAAAADAASSLAELRALVHATQQKTALPSDKLLRLTDEQLAPEVATLFALNAGEKSAVEGALTEAYAQLTRLMGDNIDGLDRSAPPPVLGPGVGPAGVSFRLKLYPEAGGKVHDQLVGALRATLGPERYAALMTLMAGRFERVVGGGFGALPRTVRIDRMGSPGSAPRRYVIRDTVRTVGSSIPDAAQPATPVITSMSSNVLMVDREKLERDYPEFVKLLPADF